MAKPSAILLAIGSYEEGLALRLKVLAADSHLHRAAGRPIAAWALLSESSRAGDRAAKAAFSSGSGSDVTSRTSASADTPPAAIAAQVASSFAAVWPVTSTWYPAQANRTAISPPASSGGPGPRSRTLSVARAPSLRPAHPSDQFAPGATEQTLQNLRNPCCRGTVSGFHTPPSRVACGEEPTCRDRARCSETNPSRAP